MKILSDLIYIQISNDIYLFKVGFKFMFFSKNSIIKHNSLNGFNSEIFKQEI